MNENDERHKGGREEREKKVDRMGVKKVRGEGRANWLKRPEVKGLINGWKSGIKWKGRRGVR